MGTKFKFWYSDGDLGQALFKQGRPNTGENWAEKVACDLADALGLPHAHYELARFRDMRGTVTPSLVDAGERIIHGNELLAVIHPDYGQEGQRYRQRQHTITRVLSYLRAVSGRKASPVLPPANFQSSLEIADALDVFVGYLMFDTWIGNQDRHDQNWAVGRAADGTVRLLPSYDHGSSLGRNELEQVMHDRLTTSDMGRHISAYIRKARSAIFPHSAAQNAKALLTADAFLHAAKLRPIAAAAWIERIRNLDEPQFFALVDRIPELWMTETAKQFAKEYLRLNRLYIINLEL